MAAAIKEQDNENDDNDNMSLDGEEFGARLVASIFATAATTAAADLYCYA